MSRSRGYLLVGLATTLWGLNASVSKVVLAHGFDTPQLTQARVTGAFLGLAAILLATRPHTLRATRREAAYLAAFGLVGLNGVQLFYFLAIEKLPIGIALLVEYTAPVLVALYARFFLKQPVGRRLWAAIALVLLGLALMVQAFSGGGSLSGVGLTFAAMAALAYALYILMTERIMEQRPPVATICWGFGVAAVFWAVVRPWWEFPWGRLGDSVSLSGRLDQVTLPAGLLVASVVVLGTLIPFAMLVSALHALPASRVTLLATFEPVAGAIIAWAWLDERLTGVQLTGAVLVLAGIILAETVASLQISH
ncbi:MAG: DMT family transporter [Gaiellales bacterium]